MRCLASPRPASPRPASRRPAPPHVASPCLALAKVGEALRSAGLNPSSMPTHRPPALAAAVELLDDRDGRYARCRKR